MNYVAQRIEFFVPGVPRPGGSKTAGYNRKTGKSFVREAGKHTADWRAVVSLAASEAMGDRPLLTGPLRLDINFYFERPKNHYRTRNGLISDVVKLSAPVYKITMPDRTKLTRSTEDAMTKIVWRDDAQVCDGRLVKRYGEKPGALIIITELPETQ